MKKFIIIAAISFAAGIGSMLIFEKKPEATQKGPEIKMDDRAIGFKSCKDEFPLISEELDCGSINERIDQVEALDREIETYINQEITSKNAAQISVFFRDLKTRRWFGVNEDVNFYPASLAKLPFTMMMYKVAEIDKAILDQPITITKDDLELDNEQHYKPDETLQLNTTYTVSELLRRILTYSDNAPTSKLMDLSSSLSEPILNDLGVLFPPDIETGVAQWNITAKIYANFFRILYNASYLRPEYSNIILTQLSQSTFTRALVAGLPDGTLVAHKFGEVSQVDPHTNKLTIVLNDCGIVYKENSPYILCVMTQGNDFAKLERTIRDISKMVYESSF